MSKRAHATLAPYTSMLCENALALGCEQSNVFLLNISVYFYRVSDQVANKDREYYTTNIVAVYLSSIVAKEVESTQQLLRMGVKQK